MFIGGMIRPAATNPTPIFNNISKLTCTRFVFLGRLESFICVVSALSVPTSTTAASVSSSASSSSTTTTRTTSSSSVLTFWVRAISRPVIFCTTIKASVIIAVKGRILGCSVSKPFVRPFQLYVFLLNFIEELSQR